MVVNGPVGCDLLVLEQPVYQLAHSVVKVRLWLLNWPSFRDKDGDGFVEGGHVPKGWVYQSSVGPRLYIFPRLLVHL